MNRTARPSKLDIEASRVGMLLTAAHTEQGQDLLYGLLSPPESPQVQNAHAQVAVLAVLNGFPGTRAGSTFRPPSLSTEYDQLNLIASQLMDDSDDFDSEMGSPAELDVYTPHASMDTVGAVDFDVAGEKDQARRKPRFSSSSIDVDFE